MKRLWLATLLLAVTALGASRARTGGTLKVVATAKFAETDPLLADTPLEATLGSLLNRPLCRLERNGSVVPVLAAELTRSAPTVLRGAVRPGLNRASGTELSASEVAQNLVKIAQGGSPYRALLAPMKTATASELTLSYPFPDFEKALCHPALAPPGVGPYRTSNGTFTANVFYPEGRPFTDALTVTSTDARGVERAMQQRRANLVLGPGTTDERALLYATFLSFNPARAGPDFRAAFETAVERTEMTRLWVHMMPAAPMSQLLPPLLALGMTEPAKPTRPAPPIPPRELTLIYDSALDDHRAVAEFLQVKLHAAGYHVALKSLSRAQLRAATHYDLRLDSVLVPPVPSLAIALALELGGQHEQLPTQLAALGAITDDKARAGAAQQLAKKLWSELPLIPLYVQGLGIQAGKDVQNLKLDAQGLPLLDGVFLGQD